MDIMCLNIARVMLCLDMQQFISQLYFVKYNCLMDDTQVDHMV